MNARCLWIVVWLVAVSGCSWSSLYNGDPRLLGRESNGPLSQLDRDPALDFGPTPRTPPPPGR